MNPRHLRTAALAALMAACGPSPAPPEDARPASPPPAAPPAAAPVPPPPRYPAPSAPARAGMRDELGATLKRVVDAAIASGATPGASVAVGRGGHVVVSTGFGRTDWAPGAPAVTDSTLYDLASLTKAVATTTAAMMLEERGQLDIDQPVARYLPGFSAPDKAAITPRMLLTHSSGLRSDHHLYRQARGRGEYLARINARRLAYTPGTRTAYDDWNMVVLQLAIERITGQPLDRWLREQVYGPLGMRDTGFNPADSLRPRVAPTEVQAFRGGQVWGEVHDENAWALGGVAGHAGLFSSARDLAVFARMMLNGGQLGGVRLARAETVARWTRRQPGRGTRALGWDTGGAGGRAFGHMGFTGTSLWMDPGTGVFVVLLTNRVNPTRDNTRHTALRRAVAGAVLRAVLPAPSPGAEREAE